MATPVEAPKLGNTVEECIVARWHKHPGEVVAAGDLVVEIETDKATFEVTAPLDGTLLAAFFDEGALVPVFTNLFVIGAPGENTDAFRPLPTGGAAPAAEEAAGRVPAHTAARAPAPAPATPRTAAASAYSPRARRFAEEHNFHPSAVRGSGPGGRVVEEDLRALFYNGGVAAAAARAPATAPAAAATASPPRPATLRDKIARRMRESLASTAQYTLHATADATSLLSLRARIKASSAPSVNINDLVAWATIQALLRTPSVNAEYVDGKLVPHSEVHLGFACDTPRGLLVPVIRNAHTLPIAALAAAARELAAKAVKGNINPDDLSGATFTISNLGNLGIEQFTPLLNPPQVAILGVGAITLKPVRRNSQVEFIDMIALSLTCDHQVLDGAPGARFLATVRDEIENVESRCTI